ncbi:MAG: lipopolysaccharide kinase InaA family protein [Bacteroidales bacterium]
MKSKVIINPKFSFIEEYIHNIPSISSDVLGDVIYNARNQIYANTVNGVNLVIKSFHVPSILNRVIYSYFRDSKAKRSYDNAQELCRLAIGTAEPIAYIEIYKGGLIEHSYYISTKLEANDIRWWEKIENRELLLKNLGAFITKLHTKGVFHKDFSPGNILYNIDEGGGYNFYLIDINRMLFNVKDRGVLMQNFKCLHDDIEQTTVVASYYADNIDSSKRTELIEQALKARAKYKKGQARKRKLKKLIGRGG